jgi:hypothetical protein
MLDAAGGLRWQIFDNQFEEEGLTVQFPLPYDAADRKVTKTMKKAVADNNVPWINTASSKWVVNVTALSTWFKKPVWPRHLDWLSGNVLIEPEVIHLKSGYGDHARDNTALRLVVYKETYMAERNRRVFLSHKGVDKPFVERVFRLLSLLGFDPWLDQHALNAGAELDRAILQGFKDSCAVVYFITPNFVDDAFLRDEINYAKEQKRQKGDRFAIISLEMTDPNGKARRKKGEVPDLLRPYVWKSPTSELEAVIEILKALPITVGPVDWRAGL